jgi:adenylate kinase
MRVLVTGTPCTGKTTVSKLLSKKLSYKYISLLDLVKSFGLYESYDQSADEYVIDLETVSNWIRDWIKDKDNLVIESLYPHVFPNEYIDYVFVLRSNPKRLKECMKERNYPEEKILNNLRAEMYDWCLLRAMETFDIEKIHEIYYENPDWEKITQEIIEVIQGKRKPRIYENLPFSKDFYKYL